MVALCAVIAFGEPLAAVCLGVIGLAAATALNAMYARALGRRGRSARRITGDHRVALHVSYGLGLPLVAAIVAAILSYRPHEAALGFTHGEFAALFVTAGVLMVGILVSSLIDWYYIRPRLDGLVWPPPCRADANAKAQWKRVTRRWYLHRGLATLAYIAFAITVAIIIMIMLVREHPAAAAVIGGVSGIAGLLLIFAGSYRSALPTIARWVLSPTFVLGDDLEYEGYGGKKRGYVLHVAVPVVKLVPLNDHGKPTGVPFIEVKTQNLDQAELSSKPTIACASKCARLNPECFEEHLQAKRRRDHKRRILIL